jgi:hypothetical protein
VGEELGDFGDVLWIPCTPHQSHDCGVRGE